MICLDAEAHTRDKLTITSSLRGYLDFIVKVKVAERNIHSGVGGGIYPNPFEIMIKKLQILQDFAAQTVHPDL